MTTTDCELIELAAKAAGYQVEWVRNSGCHYRCEEDIGREQWCPLDDDGDALRLAVRLNIGIRSHGPAHWQQPNTSVALYEVGEFSGGRVTIEHGAEPSAATRRAIVRAAAAIGEAMP